LKRPIVVLLAAAVAGGCDGSKKKASSDPSPLPTAASAAVPRDAPPKETILDLTSSFEACTSGHSGTLVDLGDEASLWRFGRLRKPDVELVEHEGATWVRARSKLLSFAAVLTQVEPDASSVVAARIRGGAARAVNVSVNGKPIGSWTLTKHETKIVVARAPLASLLTGVNEVQLRFVAPAHTTATEALADLDWVHLGTTDVDASFGAPTRQDAITSASVGGAARRAISLRGPGFMRCGGYFPSGSRLEALLGLAGGADADVEVRLHRDRHPPTVIGSMHLTDQTAWKPVDLTLPQTGHGALELAVVRAAKGARALFGEPRVVRPAGPATPATAPARGAILVVLGSTASRALGIYGGRHPMPELGTLASKGVVFERHRASSSYSAASFASALTGVEPLAHGIVDRDAKLSEKVTTVADAARQAGILTAFFTGNPTSGSVFGFDRGWETFSVSAPDAAPGEPFEAASKWIESKKSERFLVVVHARGGHPPWDATPEELKTLDPQGYTGPLDPHHAAELLARARKSPPALRFGDADRARAWALYALALEKHDAALGRMMATLKTTGRESDTAVLVTSDAAPDEAAHFPFGESDSLDEASLAVPLVMRFPASRGSGRRVSAPTASIDLAPSLLAVLGLPAPKSFEGIDVTRDVDAAVRPMLASLSDHFSLEWGGLVLVGAGDRPSKLCDLSLEPTCVSDVRPSYPLGAEQLQRVVYERLATRARATRVPASIDSATGAQLKVWGR
jgi:arylsulfatase A-like enzyme